MINTTISLKEYPTSVKLGILFLALGWILHYVFYFILIPGEVSEKILYLQLGVGVAICYFVASINKWARALCMFFNFGLIVLYLLWYTPLLFAARFQSSNKELYLFTAVVALVFGLSTYYLSRKKTTQYFNEFNQSDEEGDVSDPKDE